MFYVEPDVDAETDVGQQAGVAVDLLHGVEGHLRPLNAVLLPVNRRVRLIISRAYFSRYYCQKFICVPNLSHRETSY